MIHTSDLSLAIKKAVEAEREACAKIAEHWCLVPPDGGSPTEAEKEMCDGIAKEIRGRTFRRTK